MEALKFSMMLTINWLVFHEADDKLAQASETWYSHSRYTLSLLKKETFDVLERISSDGAGIGTQDLSH